MEIDYVVKFEENIRRLIWGSEHWAVSVHPAAPSVVANGPLAGKKLSELVPGFPLLIKVIDAGDRLSLQVHPNERTVETTGGDPKTEMWCMLRDGAIYAGFKPGVDRETVVDSIARGTVENLLVRHECSKGDAVYIPGGLVHAIGENVRLYEVQQSSDTTFRFHDWGRVDKDGKPRELHIEKSLAAMDFSLPPPERRRDIASPFFDFRQLRLEGSLTLPPSGGYTALFAADGEFSANGIVIAGNESALVPPGLECTLSGAAQTVFVTRVPT